MLISGLPCEENLDLVYSIMVPLGSCFGGPFHLILWSFAVMVMGL